MNARPLRIACLACVMLGISWANGAFAQPSPAGPAPSAAEARPPIRSQAAAAPQGVAVLGAGSSRDAAFTVARALYASRLRPTSLDEVRARILAGDPAPEGASREIRELGELRAGIGGSDAASRRLLGAIADQINVKAILVVQAEPSDAGAEPAPATARLFLADSGELDAARYGPEPGVEGSIAWRATVSSLERRFGTASAPPAAVAATPVAPKNAPRNAEEGSKPFYASAWFWAAVGGAALVGGAIYFVSRDTTSDTIHLQMRVPR